MNLKSKNAKIAIAVIVVLALVGLGAYYQMRSTPFAEMPTDTATTTPTAPTTVGAIVKSSPSGTAPAGVPAATPGTSVSVVSQTYQPDGWAIAFDLPAEWRAQPTIQSGKVTRVTIGNGADTMMVSKDVVIAPPASGTSVTRTEMIFGSKVEVKIFNGTTGYFVVHKDAADYYFRTDSMKETPEKFIAILESVNP